MADPWITSRQSLRDAIAKLAAAITDGERRPSRVELDRLIELCQEYFLPTEAATVSRWRSGR